MNSNKDNKILWHHLAHELKIEVSKVLTIFDLIKPDRYKKYHQFSFNFQNAITNFIHTSLL